MFRSQDVKEVYKELRYCSEQMSTLNFVFNNVGDSGGSEYIACQNIYVKTADSTRQ